MRDASTGDSGEAYVARINLGHGAAEHQIHIQAKDRAGDARGAAPVGLVAAAGQQAVAAVSGRIAQQVFELANFVAAKPETGQVVPLAVDLCAEHLAQSGQRLNGCGCLGKRQTIGSL